ncbi:MAG: hypothetical protein HN341_15755 [Verrucomicrobia bacterium]|nr:hypothetical protein [Verrucomicrobiota bacterium]
MKQIVEGTVYDTEMATRFVSHDNKSHWISDRGAISSGVFTETLYRTENGNWFQIRERRVLIFKRETMFVPMSEEEAFNWLHRFNEIKVLRRYFRDRVSEG